MAAASLVGAPGIPEVPELDVVADGGGEEEVVHVGAVGHAAGPFQLADAVWRSSVDVLQLEGHLLHIHVVCVDGLVEATADHLNWTGNVKERQFKMVPTYWNSGADRYLK